MPLTKTQETLVKIITDGEHPLYIDESTEGENPIQTRILCRVINSPFFAQMSFYPVGSYVLCTRQFYNTHQSVRYVGDIILEANVYFLGWKSNNVTQLALTDKADVFVTPSLSGCTFVATRGEKTKVFHANFTHEDSGSIDQQRIDVELKQKVPADSEILKVTKSNYAYKNKHVTSHAADSNEPVISHAAVIGVRGSEWMFVSQYYAFNILKDKPQRLIIGESSSASLLKEVKSRVKSKQDSSSDSLLRPPHRTSSNTQPRAETSLSDNLFSFFGGLLTGMKSSKKASADQPNLGCSPQ